MIKNILIISSDYTGHGHKSITEALCEKFSQYEDINIKVIDGFSLGGKAMIQVGKSYGTITRNAKELWKLIWKISLTKPQLIDEAVEIIIKENLLNVLEQTKPDLILSVHPNFNGSVLNAMEKAGIRVPFVTLIADLVSISPHWVDPRADWIISPTIEAKSKCTQFKFPGEKIKVMGFPVRSRFFNHNVGNRAGDNLYNRDMPLKCLIMSGGEGSGNMSKIATILLENFNCSVKIVAGRNKSARKKLERELCEKFGEKVEVYGFVNNIHDLMMSSDIAFTRGSPNVMMEAISCNTPIVITGALPCQEQGNPEFAAGYNLGVVYEDLDNLHKTIKDLLSDNAFKLNQIKKSQKQFANPHIAANIVNFILGLENEKEILYFKRKMII